jgi:hypothetical protein
MKSHRLMLLFVVVALSAAAFAGSDTQAPSEAQKSFTVMKSLAGSWKGPVTIDPPQAEMTPDGPVMVSMRITSRGNALVHEMKDPSKADDPTKYDDPITMFYVDNDRLNLVHYCDAGNRPHMVAKASPDGKKVEFDFADLSGSNQHGHMYHAVFTIIDADHHTEDWTYMMPGDKPMHAHMDLQRSK